MNGEILPRLARLGPSEISEWLNNGRRPVDWIASAHSVREFAEANRTAIKTEDLSAAVEPVVLRDQVVRYFTTNSQERARYSPQLEILSFLIARNLQLPTTQLNATDVSMKFVAVLSVVVDEAVTSSSYAISSHPVRDLFQSLESIAELNPKLAPAISWFTSAWRDLVAVGRELLVTRVVAPIAQEESFRGYSERQLTREMQQGFEAAVEFLRVELELREILGREARRASVLWTQPALWLAERFGVWEEKAIVLDDRSAMAQSSRAPGAYENIERFRAHCLQELKSKAGYNTWIVTDAVDQWSAVLDAGRAVQERGLPTLLTVLETLDQIIEKKFYPEGIQELLQALRMPDTVCNERTVPILESWCVLLQEAASSGASIHLFGLNFSPLHDPHSRDALFSCLRKHRASDEKIVLVGRDLLDVRITESLGFEPTSIGLLTGATSHNCITELDRSDMMLYCLNEVMFDPDLPPAGIHRSVGLQLSGNTAFLEEVNRVAPLSESALRKEWFGGTHDFLVIAGGRRDQNYGFVGNPADRSRLLI